jgi:hypothetical protein
MAMQAAPPVDFFLGDFSGNSSGAASADEWNVIVIGFKGSAAGTGRGIPTTSGIATGGELHFANQLSAPSLVNSGADFAFHAFKLLLPRLSIRRQFQAAALAP